MGIDIEQDQFSSADHERFGARIRDNLKALRVVLARPDFGRGPMSLGAELECYLVDSVGLPVACNQEILQLAHEPQWAPELNRFNLEFNLTPQTFVGQPFSGFEQELRQAFSRVNAIAIEHHATLLPIGILPTLEQQHFNQHTMTDLPRYRAMDAALKTLRGGAFSVDIDGDPSLHLQWNDVTLEGANTSFQLHWRMNPEEFRDSFNAVQLVTPIVLALAANSPFLFGHALWDETRIALFKQSIDCRGSVDARQKYPPRVYFGNGWLQQGALELFASTVALFPPILPVVSNDDPMQQIAEGQLPVLHELKLHQGSTWPWNRAIYDHHDGGHIRIEVRALPAGPSFVDMHASSAFLLGCALALRDSMPERINLLPFKYAERNFYRAAQVGLDATLLWPSSSQVKVVEYPLLELAQRLVPMAQAALEQHGMASDEVTRLMNNIQERINARVSGARWQRLITQQFEHRGMTRQQALQAMLQRYRTHFESGQPLINWSTSI